MATNKLLGVWNTKSTTGKTEEEVPILSVYVDDRTVKCNIEMVSMFVGCLINSENSKS